MKGAPMTMILRYRTVSSTVVPEAPRNADSCRIFRIAPAATRTPRIMDRASPVAAICSASSCFPAPSIRER